MADLMATDDTTYYKTGKTTNSDDVNYYLYTQYYKDLYDRIPNVNYDPDMDYTKDKMYEMIMDNSPDKPNINDDFVLKLDASTVKRRIMHEDPELIIYDKDIDNTIDTPEPELPYTNFNKEHRKIKNSKSRQDIHTMQTYKADTPLYTFEGKTTDKDLIGDQPKYRGKREKIAQNVLRRNPNLINHLAKTLVVGPKLSVSEQYDIRVNKDPTMVYNIKKQTNAKKNNDTTQIIPEHINVNSEAERLYLRSLYKTREQLDMNDYIDDTPKGYSMNVPDSYAPNMNNPMVNKKLYDFMKSNKESFDNRINSSNMTNKQIDKNNLLYTFIKRDDITHNVRSINKSKPHNIRCNDMDTGMNGYEFIQNINNQNLPNVVNIQRKDKAIFEVVLDNAKVVKINSNTMYSKEKIQQFYESIDPQYKYQDMVQKKNYASNYQTSNMSNMVTTEIPLNNFDDFIKSSSYTQNIYGSNKSIQQQQESSTRSINENTMGRSNFSAAPSQPKRNVETMTYMNDTEFIRPSRR